MHYGHDDHVCTMLMNGDDDGGVGGGVGRKRKER